MDVKNNYHHLEINKIISCKVVTVFLVQLVVIKLKDCTYGR